MNFRALSNFLRIVEAGSLKAAADIVNIAQPALTRQIAMLENEYGTRLFLRHHRGVTLTEAGEQLRGHAERILAEIARAQSAMSVATEKPTGTVSLGLPTAMRYVLSSAVIIAYHKAYPDVQLKVHEAFVHVIDQMLQMREADVAILFDGPRKNDSFDLIPLVAEDVYLAGPANAGLSLNKPVPIKFLAEVPVIFISRRNELRLTAERAMARHGLDFQPFLEVEGQPLTVDLVKKGIGYTITPYCAVQAEIEAGQMSGAPIQGFTINWALGVNRVRAHVPAVRELIAFIQRAVNDRVASGSWRAVLPDTACDNVKKSGRRKTPAKRVRGSRAPTSPRRGFKRG